MALDLKTTAFDLKKIYTEMPLTRRLIIGGILGIVVCAFAYLIFFGDNTKYDYLFTNMDSTDQGEIVKVLKEKNVPYKLEQSAIQVPRDKVLDIRLELAAQGLPKGKGVGFEIFDEQKLGQSDFVQDVNMKRALQGELARTISQLDKVETARVHLVTPKKSLFKEDEQQPSASVVLKLKPQKKLESGEVQSIVHLVSSAVEGLTTKNITVIDSEGNLLNRAQTEDDALWGGTPIEIKKKMENDLTRKVEEIVAHVVGAGRVVAKVNVEVDFKRETETRESFDPEQVVVRSERRSKENRKNDEAGGAAGGVPGAQSNTPAGPSEGGGKNSSNAERENDLINYEINKVTQQTVRSLGDIKRLSVAVIVDGTYEEAAAANEKEKPAEEGAAKKKYQPRSEEDLAKIRAVVMRVVGFNQARGDSIEVSNVPFETSILDDSKVKKSFFERYDWLPPLMRYSIVLIMAIAMVFLVFRPLISWVIKMHDEERLREIEREQEDVVKSMEEQLVEVRRTIETSTVEYKRRLQEVAVQMPDAVLGVLRNWMNASE